MTMIEKVAAAMAEATNGGKWDDGHYCEDHRALWMKRARAAIEALREPSEEMKSACMPPRIGSPMESYVAMIDAALGIPNPRNID